MCTAAGDEIAKRMAQVEHVRANLDRLGRTPNGLLLTSLPDRTSTRSFGSSGRREGLLPFWGFEIDTAGEDLTLRWDGPPDTTELMDRSMPSSTGTSR